MSRLNRRRVSGFCVCKNLTRKMRCQRRIWAMEQPPFSFMEPWTALAPGKADDFLRELRIELSPGHPLYGVNLKAIATSLQADDVLFQLDDGRVCQMHLTWRKSAERPPWPHHQMFARLEDWVSAVMVPDHEDYGR
jgi:hypothetical protein